MRVSTSLQPTLTRSSAERRRAIWRPSLRAAGMACLIALLASQARAADPESEFRGRRLAEANCAHCHAIAFYDPSENTAAPPFRDLRRKISLASLRKQFAGDFFRRHPEMPDFEPTRDQIDDIVDFIESIQR